MNQPDPSTDSQRLGQQAFNDFASKHPRLAMLITGTDDDPFYDDERLPIFKARVRKLLAENGEPHEPEA
jgi:hypothetical protein